jgi:hypothetical protein
MRSKCAAIRVLRKRSKGGTRMCWGLEYERHHSDLFSMEYHLRFFNEPMMAVQRRLVAKLGIV